MALRECPPLRGQDGGFAGVTILKRLPRIARTVASKGGLDAEQVELLVNEIEENAELSFIPGDDAWNAHIEGLCVCGL
jgi:hypothetical protein